MRVLVVDDDRSVATLVRRVLEEDGYAVDVASTGNEGRALALVNDYDAIVLDLQLPDRHGVEILLELRREGRGAPVLVLTGVDDPAAMVRVLDAGADDYVIKPMDNAVLRARVRAIVRRGGGARRSEELRVGALVLNRLTRRVLHATREVALTGKEYALLEHLLLHAGEVVTRSELLEKVWDMHFDPGSNIVDAHVARLRRKLASAGVSVTVDTVRGIGFVIREGAPSPPDRA